MAHKKLKITKSLGPDGKVDRIEGYISLGKHKIEFIWEIHEGLKITKNNRVISLKQCPKFIGDLIGDEIVKAVWS